MVVNGRFLRTPEPVGMHRVARALTVAAREAGLGLEVVAPRDVHDPLVDRGVAAPPGRAGAHLWEQVALPVAARGRPVLSLANTAPVALRRAAVMVHDLAWRVEPRWYARSVRLYGAAVMAAARRARVVLAPSGTVAGELVAAGLPAARVSVVRNAVDPDWTAPSPEAVAATRARLGLERPYLVLTGWANPRKDAITAVRAHLALVERAGHDLVLAGAGSPTFGPVELPAATSVRRLGHLPDAELRALVGGASALLSPSLYEGFGLPPLEALSAGVPAIVSDIPAHREAAGDAAVFVPAGDVPAWTAAIEAALCGGIAAGTPPAWTWADAVAQLLDALAPLL